MARVEIAPRRKCDRCRIWIGVYHVEGGARLSCGQPACLTEAERTDIEAQRNRAIEAGHPPAACGEFMSDGSICGAPAWRMEGHSGIMKCGAHYHNYDLEDLRAAALG